MIVSEVVNYGSSDWLGVVHDVTPDVAVDAVPTPIFVLMMLISDMKATSRKCVQDVGLSRESFELRLHEEKKRLIGIWNVTPTDCGNANS